jgi:hypothetical protein
VLRSAYHLHSDQNVARKGLSLNAVALTVADFDLFLGRNDDLIDTLAQIESIYTGFDGFLDFILIAGVGVQDVPASFRRLGGLTGFGGTPCRKPFP